MSVTLYVSNLQRISRSAALRGNTREPALRPTERRNLNETTRERNVHRGRCAVKAIVRAAAQDGTMDDAVEQLKERYDAALDKYQGIVDRNSSIFMYGGRASVQSLIDEESAFEALDCARHALLVAAERAYPTIH